MLNPGRVAVQGLLVALGLMASPLAAASDPELEALKETVRLLQEQLDRVEARHEAEVQDLKRQLSGLEARPPAAAPADAALEREFAEALGEMPETAPRLIDQVRTGGKITLGNYLDISANVDMVSRLHSNRLRRDRDHFQIREVELGLSGAVDPYGRFVLYIGMHEGHGHDDHGHDHGAAAPRFPTYRSPLVNQLALRLDRFLNWFWENRYWHPREHEHDEWELHVEEAYFTFDKLPHNLQLKLGKFRPSIGRANVAHLHDLPWTDYPLVIENNFGREGLMGTGASLSWLVPNPWDHYLLLTYEAFRNDSHSLFAGRDSNDLVHLLNIKNFWAFTPEHSLELGLTGAWGPNDGRRGSSATTLQAIDLTYQWRPEDTGLYRSLLFQNELFFIQKDVPWGKRQDTYGWYSGLEYQFARRWSAGLRYDFAQWPDDSRFREHTYQVHTTFRQSEFAFWRLGYRHRNPNFGSKYNNDELFLQLNVSLGAHAAHRY